MESELKRLEEPSAGKGKTTKAAQMDAIQKIMQGQPLGVNCWFDTVRSHILKEEQLLSIGIEKTVIELPLKQEFLNEMKNKSVSMANLIEQTAQQFLLVT